MDDKVSSESSETDIILKFVSQSINGAKKTFENKEEYDSIVKSGTKMLINLYAMYDELSGYVKLYDDTIKNYLKKNSLAEKIGKSLNEVDELIKNVKLSFDKTTYYIHTIYNMGILNYDDAVLLSTLVLYAVEIYSKIIEVLKTWNNMDFSNDKIENICSEEISGIASIIECIIDQENILKIKIGYIIRNF